MSRKYLQVRLIRHTPEPEETIALAAKLCYSSATIEELSRGLASLDQAAFINKLLKMGHLSPIEHASFTFGVEGASRSLLAQVTRHRLASFSVKSQRYVKSGGEGNSPDNGLVAGDSESGAGISGDGVFGYIVPPRIEALGQGAVCEFEHQMAKMQEWYNFWEERLGWEGIEDARFVLPNAAETRFLVTMNARELMHFFNLRCCLRAQWEIRTLADNMLCLVKGVCPTVFAFAGPSCVGGPCPEGSKNCGQLNTVRKRYRNLTV